MKGRRVSQSDLGDPDDEPMVLARISDFAVVNDEVNDEVNDDPSFDRFDIAESCKADALDALHSRLRIGGLVLAVGIFGFLLGRMTAPKPDVDLDSVPSGQAATASEPPAWNAPTLTAPMVEPSIVLEPPTASLHAETSGLHSQPNEPSLAPMLVTPSDLSRADAEKSVASGNTAAYPRPAMSSEKDAAEQPAPTTRTRMQTAWPLDVAPQSSPRVTANRPMALEDASNRSPANVSPANGPSSAAAASLARRPNDFGRSVQETGSRPPVYPNTNYPAPAYPTTDYPAGPQVTQPVAPTGTTAPARYY